MIWVMTLRYRGQCTVKAMSFDVDLEQRPVKAVSYDVLTVYCKGYVLRFRKV